MCLQSTHMASPEVSEVTVYLCTGNPLPEDVEQICQWLFNAPFVQAFNSAPLATMFLGFRYSVNA